MSIEQTPEQSETQSGSLNDHQLREKVALVLEEFGKECARNGADASRQDGPLTRAATDRVLSWVALAHPDHTNHVHDDHGPH